MALKILALEGLNNAKLCSMVEPVLCSVEGVNSAQIDYLSQRLTMDISGRPTEDAVNDVMELLKKTFPDVRIRFSDAAVFKQPKLNTTPYHSAEPSEDDYYIEDDYDEEPAPTPEPSIPWTQRLRERAATLGTQEILQVIFWTSVGLSLLFLLMSGSWRDSGTAHPYLSAMSFFFAIFSSLFMGENARCDSWLIRAAAVVSTLAIFIVGFHAQAVLAFLVYTTGMMFVDAFYNRFDEKTAKELVFFPQSITCIRSDQTLKVAPEEVREGDLLVFEEGEVLPFRGVLERNAASILSFGETQPHMADVGDILQRGDKSAEGSITVSIVEPTPGLLIPSARALVTDASLENTDLVSRSKIWIVVMTGVGAAAAMIYYLVNYGLRIDSAGIRSLALLLAALFPCGLSVACQLAQRGCLCFLSNRGILLGSVHLLERIPKLKKAVMNHLGFVTEGNMHVEEFVAVEGVKPEEVIEAAAAVELLVEGGNLISEAIIRYAMEHLGLEQAPSTEDIEGFEVLEGYGIRGMRQDVLVMVGSERMMTEIGLEVPVLEDGRMAIYVAIRGEYVGAFVLNDNIREDSVALIRDLHQSGVEEVGLLTGYDGVAVRAATLMTGADSSYIESTHRERRSLLERLRGGDEHGKGGCEVALIGPAGKVREFFDVGICLETGCLYYPDDSVLPREQEVQLARIGPKDISELIKACHVLSRILPMDALVLIVPKAFLIVAVMLWRIPLPVVYAVNVGISLLLYLLASSLFSEDKGGEKPKDQTAEEQQSQAEEQLDYGYVQ